MSEKFFLIAGGDERCVRLAGILSREGGVAVLGFDDRCPFPEEVRRLSPGEPLAVPPDCLILPAPVSKNGLALWTPLGKEAIPLSRVLDLCGADTLIFGGKLSEKFLQACKERGLTTEDYLSREEFSVLNAVPTAEGALQIALEELPVSLNGIPTLITGYGRVAKLCHRVFSGAGAAVTVTARSAKDLAWAEAYGASPLPLSGMNRQLPRFQLILNTVPTRLFGENELSLLDKNALFIDLASAPGGVDFQAAEELGIRAIPALSLPGKTAPDTAAAILARTVRNILTERGNACV